MIRLGDLCKTAAGGTPLKSSKEFYEGGAIPWLVSGEVNNRNITSTKRFITQLGLNGSSAKVFPANTVVIAMYGATAGEVGILKFPTSTNQAVCGIYPNEKVLPEYLYYFFLSHKSALVAQAVGNAQPNISQQKIKDTYIDVPPIPEQQRIVAILDQAFADIEKARANAEKNLKNARELFESYLQQVFSQRGEGWSSVEASNLVSISHGYSFKSPEFDTNFGGETPIVLTPGNFTSEGTLYFNSKNTKRLKTSGYENLLFNEGDLVIVMTDLSSKMLILGKPAIIDREGILHNQRIGRFKFHSEKVDKNYLYYFFLSDLSLRHIRETSTGTMVRHTAPKRILANNVPYPVDVSKQQKIAEQLSWLKKKTSQLEAIYETKLNSLDELKKSLLQKAFSGELTKSKGIAA